MVGTIGLVVHEDRRKVTSERAMFMIAAAVAGGLTGWLASIFGVLIEEVAAPSEQLQSIALVALCGLVILESWNFRRFRPWGPLRQVSETTRQMHGAVRTSVSWGMQLGLAVVTRTNTWALWLFLATLAMVGDPVVGAVSGLAFGAVRGSQPLATAYFGGANGRQITERAMRWESRLRITQITATASVMAFVWS